MMAHGTGLIRRLVGIVAVATLAGCGSAVHDAAPSRAQLAADLQGSPSPLAALHAQANQLLGGGASALRARLRALRGYPVVVTQWASWCGPCRAEFPYFQQLSAKLGRRVAFIGNDAGDTTAAARDWLRRFPVSFPSYRDPGGQIALALSPYFALDTPVTYLYTRRGVQYSNVGPYTSQQALRRQIRADLGV
jgi:thiol-disulfide isomerase/thioredoxin